MEQGSGLDTGCMDRLASVFEGRFGASGPHGGAVLVLAPGRSEICGNHTDHEGGEVVAGAVSRYVRGIFAPNGTNTVRIASEGFPPIEVSCDDTAVHVSEKNGSAALVRGLLAGFRERGVAGEEIGFDAVMESEVPAGSGLSSSAAFELAIAQAMNALWTGGAIPALALAQMSQTAERTYFGKPCGLMDQASVAVGGIAHMNFYDAENPRVEKIDFDFARAGYSLVLVSVGADHSANTDDYAAVPAEMQAVAQAFGHTQLSRVAEADLLHNLPAVRERLGDRAALRALHYFREERFVKARVEALRAGDMDSFLELTQLSGASSAMYLQNVSIGGSAEQPGMVALAVAEELLGGRGAARVHGGGFGGTIQAFVPLDETDEFCAAMDEALGAPSAAAFRIDHEGARAQWL